MMPIDSEPLTCLQAIALLHQFTHVEQNPQTVLPSRAEIYSALSVVLDESEYQMLGICAPDFATGARTLGQYLAALGYDLQPEIQSVSGPCYIKYNTKTRTGYAAHYTDDYRGVLISCQSSYDDGVNETFGHFPLDLFQPE